jgi:predicted P-loop ATPase
MKNQSTVPSTTISLKEIQEEIISLKNEENKKAKSRLELIEKYLNNKYSMRLNTILCLPEAKIKNEQSDYTVVNENSIYRELEHREYRCNLNLIRTLLKSNFLSDFNPIHHYFESLQPYRLEEPDYIDEIGKYLKIKHNDLDRFKVQFKKFIVRCVACSMKGIVNKQALIIISPNQNCGKSTFCRWLCPPSLAAYIQENISTDKDSQIALTENFIINMDELATLSRADLESLKSLLSKDVIKTRKPYDSKALTYKRVANFVGSTNKTEFLTDVTGSVRWLCFEVESINFNYQEIPIDRLWAQAFYLLKTEFKYQMNPNEIQENETANSKYRQISVEEDLIQRKYEIGNINDHNAFYSSTDILEQLRSDFPQLGKDLHPTRIGKALQALGFIQESKRGEAGSRKGYYVKFI